MKAYFWRMGIALNTPDIVFVRLRGLLGQLVCCRLGLSLDKVETPLLRLRPATRAATDTVHKRRITQCPPPKSGRRNAGGPKKALDYIFEVIIKHGRTMYEISYLVNMKFHI